MTSYSDLLRTLYARTTAGIKLDLVPVRALVDALGDPAAALRCVLVAGTNGKGSTSSLLASALGHAGRHVGLYTSPHLLRFAERIRIDGEPLAEARIASLFEQVRAVEGACPRQPTFFECATAMALLAFRDAAVDTAVLEVGLGGRLDATNIVRKELVVITPIGLDHQDFLGHTLEAIAGEKAAVIEPGKPVVCAPQPPEARAVIEAVAREREAPLYTVRMPASIVADGGALPPYQQVNIATARLAAQLLGVPDAAMQAAVDAFSWPGRYQWVAGAPPHLLDGAHNPAGMAALVDAIRQDARLSGRPLHAVLTALRTKEIEAMVAPIAPLCTSVHLCPVGSARTRTFAELQSAAMGASVHPDSARALAAAGREAGPTGVVVVAGSLFLVADALAALTGERRDPPVDG